jgi:Zn-dependent protease
VEDNADRSRRPDRRPGVTVGRLFGVPVYLNASWLLLAALVTLTYGQLVRNTLDLSPGAGYLVGFGFVVCLLVSVLLHELGHALTARRCGIGVRGITLELLGGYTEMDRDAPSPRVELLVSLAGPAVSLVLGGAAAGLTVAAESGTLPHELALQLAVSNIVVAAFNVLPGLPLDGGRALRAAVWAISHNRHLGTLVAGWTGRVVALATGAAALLLYGTRIFSAFGMIFMLLVALTLWQGATQAIRLAKISSRFPLIDLIRLARPVFVVPTGTPLAEAQRRAAETGPARAALAVADSSGRLVGLVQPAAAEAVPVERRPWVAVDAVSRGLDGIRAIPSGLRGEEVIRAVQADPGSEYLVTTGQDVVGVLHIADLAQLLEPGGTPQ